MGNTGLVHECDANICIIARCYNSWLARLKHCLSAAQRTVKETAAATLKCLSSSRTLMRVQM